MSAPLERQATLSAENITNNASYMEMTVPLLHEARSAGSYLSGKTEAQSSQVAAGAFKPAVLLNSPT